MGSDLEMHRGDDTRCTAHQQVAALERRLQRAVNCLVAYSIADPTEVCESTLDILAPEWRQKVRRETREIRLREAGFEEPTREQRKEQLAKNVALQDWPKKG